MEPRRKNVIGLLEHGLATLNEGWIQGEYQEFGDTEDEDGDAQVVAVCALGSLGMTDLNAQTTAEEDAICFLWNALPKYWRQQGEQKWEKGETIVNYNDKTGRKKWHVVRVFERAIGLAKAEPFPES